MMRNRKKNKQRRVFIIFSIAIFLLLGSTLMNIPSDSDAMIVGFCPTMRRYAEQYFDDGELRDMGSAGNALRALNNGQIDIAITGRKARKGEISGEIQEKILKDGYTLITQPQRQINSQQLEGMNIHTHIDENIAKELLPEAELEFHDTFDEAISEGISDAVLVDWIDVPEDYELLVVYDDLLKDERFRTPLLYHNAEFDILVEE
ncbi:MAG: hypothetical protein ACLFTR_00850 [Candidatus Woesearchaeota archaeon]